MAIQFIPPNLDSIFPHPALADKEGIVAVGGNLSSSSLITAYSFGIFPWYSNSEPIIWWSPDPRFVLFPHNLKVSKSMRPYFNQEKFKVTFDTAFENVISACQNINRMGQEGTWITQEMQNAYIELHTKGYAHSVEVWDNNNLVGGLYGISLGKMFFGESMFANVSNASKFGFITLIRILQKRDFKLIDCQQETKHLQTLGAEPIPRKIFLDLLAINRSEKSYIGSWSEWLK